MAQTNPPIAGVSIVDRPAERLASQILPIANSRESFSAIDYSQVFLNFKASNTANLKAGLAAVAAGTGRLLIYDEGDSTSAGYLAFAGNANARSGAMSAHLADELAAAGYNTCRDSTIGVGSQGNNIAAVTTYDPRWQFGASWTTYSDPANFKCAGAGSIQCIGTDPGVFTAEESFTQAEFLMAGSSTASTLVVSNDNFATSQNVASTVANGLYVYAKVTFASPGTVLRIKNTNTNNTFPVMIALSNPAKPAIELRNAGWGGASAADIAAADQARWGVSSPTSLAGLYPAGEKAVSLFNILINDAVAGTDRTAFRASLTSALKARLALGVDVIVRINGRVKYSSVSRSQYDTYAGDVLTVAASLDLPVIDLRPVYPTWAGANARGLMADALHKVSLGYRSDATLVARGLLQGF